jgi:hypothetical protein
MLVANQINGEFEAKEEQMKKYLKKVKEIQTRFKHFTILQVLCDQNMRADQLSKIASSQEFSRDDTVQIKVQDSPSIEEEGGMFNATEVEDTWITPIIQYLNNEASPSDKYQAQKLVVKAARFIMIGDELYKRGFSLPFLRCLGPKEATYIMQEVHEWVYDNHFGSRSLVQKLIRMRYNWPTMQKDVVKYVKACDKCQRFGNLLRQPPEELTPMASPFAQ